MNINALVEEMIKQHKGGEEFFDHLDESLKQKDYILALYTKAKNELRRGFICVVSGKFGLYFSQLMTDSICITVNGGLRKGEKIISLEPFKNDIKDKDFVFFDDSFYKGRTRNAVKNEIEKWGGKLIATYVCYDGSHIKDETVHSFYRYHKE